MVPSQGVPAMCWPRRGSTPVEAVLVLRESVRRSVNSAGPVSRVEARASRRPISATSTTSVHARDGTRRNTAGQQFFCVSQQVT